MIWSWKCNNVLKKKITRLQTSIIRVYWSTLNIFPQWISKPYIQQHKNHSKLSSGAARFAQNLRTCKKSQYNVRNYKSGRHNQLHTFRPHNSQYKPSSNNILYYGLKNGGRKNRKTKSSSPRQQNRMLHTIKHYHNNSLWNCTRMIPPFLHFDKPNLYNGYIFMDPEYNDQLCFLNQVDFNTDLLDNMILHQIVI